MRPIRRSFLRDNGLSLVLLALFLVFLGGLAISGWREDNSQRAEHGAAGISLASYLASSDFGEAVFENWESEFLQMSLYVLLTALLYQRGSAESKDPDASPRPAKISADAPAVVRRGGPLLALYKCSLFLALFLLFLFSFAGHALCGLRKVNEEAAWHGHPAMSLADYVGGAEFWFESFQNWQSEFLAVLAIVVLSIWLRQQGSPESKPLEAPHSRTGG